MIIQDPLNIPPKVVQVRHASVKFQTVHAAYEEGDESAIKP